MTPEELLSNFPNPDEIDAIFYKSLSRNDDSGRHGVLIPAHAYSFFPEFRNLDPAANALMPIRTAWEAGGSWFEQDSNYAYYQRYPERRLTSLLPSAVNQVSEYRLLVVARYRSEPLRFAMRVVVPADGAAYSSTLAAFGLRPDLVRLGETSGVLRVTDLGKRRAIDVLRGKLAEIAALGYVRTMRSGDTGIGYTLETLLGIDANSSLLPDFEGVEIKAGRSRLPARRRGRSTERVTLFAKTPEWGALGSREGLLDEHGYFDKDGRWSLYMSIYAGKPNPQGWSLRNDNDTAILWADRNGAAQVRLDPRGAREASAREASRIRVCYRGGRHARRGRVLLVRRAHLLSGSVAREPPRDDGRAGRRRGLRDPPHGNRRSARSRVPFPRIERGSPAALRELGTPVLGLALTLEAQVDERALQAGGPSRGAHQRPQVQHCPVCAPGVGAALDHG